MEHNPIPNRRPVYTILLCESSPLMHDNGKYFVGKMYWDQGNFRYMVESGPFATRQQCERVIHAKSSEEPTTSSRNQDQT